MLVCRPIGAWGEASLGARATWVAAGPAWSSAVPTLAKGKGGDGAQAGAKWSLPVLSRTRSRIGSEGVTVVS